MLFWHRNAKHITPTVTIFVMLTSQILIGTYITLTYQSNYITAADGKFTVSPPSFWVGFSKKIYCFQQEGPMFIISTFCPSFSYRYLCFLFDLIIEFIQLICFLMYCFLKFLFFLPFSSINIVLPSFKKINKSKPTPNVLCPTSLPPSLFSLSVVLFLLLPTMFASNAH